MYKGKDIRKHNLEQKKKAEKFLKDHDMFLKINVPQALHKLKLNQPVIAQADTRSTSFQSRPVSVAREAGQAREPSQSASNTISYVPRSALLANYLNQIESESSDSADIDMDVFLKLAEKAENKYKQRIQDDSSNQQSYTFGGGNSKAKSTVNQNSMTEYMSNSNLLQKRKQVKQKNQRKEQDSRVDMGFHNGMKLAVKDSGLRTLSCLSECTPITYNYKVGKREEWESNTQIEDYKLQFVLRKFPRIKDYKNNQKAIIKCSLLGNDVFVCMPTGGGKSLTFQAMTFIEKGIYLCILPLVSLIIDQQFQAKSVGIKALSLTGAKQKQENKQIYQQMLNYQTGSDSLVIFCTPEKVSKSPQFFSVLERVYQNNHLVKIVIDQVHCVATWGKEFRQDYENLSILRKSFPNTPILGLTATVTEIIKQDIIKRLKIQGCLYFQSSFNRSNLHYEVRPKQKNAMNEIFGILEQPEFRGQAGIIYCLSRKQCEQVCQKLRNRNYKVAFYHANINDHEKREIQEMWMRDDIKIIVATIAFGMGINKPDVRFVIHNSLSKSLQNYYQESGRAGRDGELAKCILFYRKSDKISLQNLILKNQISNHESKSFCMKQLSNMIRYCEDRFTCRRKMQLQYLGEMDFKVEECNKTCDNCLKNLNYVEVECLSEARALVEFMLEADKTNQSITQNQLIMFCKGSGEKKLQQKIGYLQQMGMNLSNLQSMFRKWSKQEIDELLIELSSYEIFFDKIVSNTFRNQQVSNIYMKTHFGNARKFLNRVQTIPMKRKVLKQKQRTQQEGSQYPESETELGWDNEQEEVSMDDGSGFEESRYQFTGPD